MFVYQCIASLLLVNAIQCDVNVDKVKNARSISGSAATSYYLKLINECSMPACIYKIDYNGVEKQVISNLLPGKSFAQKTYFGHAFAARDCKTKTMLFFTSDVNTDVFVEGTAFGAKAGQWIYVKIIGGSYEKKVKNARSISGSAATSYYLQFNNEYSMPACISWIDYKGVEKQVISNLLPGKSSAQKTYFTHPFVARDCKTKALLFLTNGVNTDKIVEGKAFGAKAGQRIYVKIIDGKKAHGHGECQVNPESRQECGYAGISKETCEKRGCCFNPNWSGVTWCYKKKFVNNDMCQMNPETRVNCGWAGITRDVCMKKGCCFNDKTPGMIWCYYQRSKNEKKAHDHGECQVNPESRQECGYGGISKETCEKRGCCFNPNWNGVKWCYKKKLPNNDMCQMNPEKRVDCGWPGIGRDVCMKKGCCFNDKSPGMIWCYYQRKAVEDNFGGICHRDFKKVGCFQRNWKVLSELLVTDLDPTHKSYTQEMNWEDYGLGLHSLACRCRAKAVGKYKYFAIGFHGECVAGKDTAAVEKMMAEGRRTGHGCVNGGFTQCDKNHKAECAGMADYDYVYEITNA